MPSALRILLFAFLLITCGCNTRVHFEDVSSSSNYRSYVGATYVLNVPMHISGVNLPPGYRKVIDVYKVNPVSSTWSGPELVTRETLPQGTVVIVDSVHRCTDCFLDFRDRVEAIITIPGYRTQFDLPIRINLVHLAHQFAEVLKAPNK
jgi:hypothetical protein